MTLVRSPLDMFKDFDKFFVGFDDTWNNFSKLHDGLTKNIPHYPPYNIKKIDENKYLVEIAVAGFTKQDLEITIDGGQLLVKGSSKDDLEHNYVFKGIANRAFTRSFALADQIEVKDAELLNGMLKVFLERIIPDHKKPKTVDIKDPVQSNKQLLQESK